jgi:hypothetical protein
VDLKEIGMEGYELDCLGSGEGQVVECCEEEMNRQYPNNTGKFSVSRQTATLSRKALLRKISCLVCLQIG